MSDRDHQEQGPLLHAFCHRCERWRVLEADAFAVDFCVGPDQPGVARCPDCGGMGIRADEFVVESDCIRCTSCGHEFDARLEMMET